MVGTIVICLLTALAAYLGVAVLLSWARHRQLLDIPNDRSSHTTPTPKGGGLVMVIITTAGALIFGVVSGEWRSLSWYLAGGVLIAAVSWVDDLRELPSAVRFAVHGVGAALAIAGFGYWHGFSLPFLAGIDLGWWGLAVTFIWIVGLTNAFNFMDGIDGIAGLQALVAGFAWALLGYWVNLPAVFVIGLLIGCSSLGFLAQNWSPAKIFMGDVGSAFLGFSLAVMPLIAANYQRQPNRTLFAGVLIMWPFVFDSALTLIRRALRGENVLRAHRSHLYQRLVILGFSHRLVASIYGLAAALSSAAAINWYLMGPAGDLFAWLAAAGLGAGLWVFTIGQERRHAATIAGPESLARERP